VHQNTPEYVIFEQNAETRSAAQIQLTFAPHLKAKVRPYGRAVFREIRLLMYSRDFDAID